MPETIQRKYALSRIKAGDYLLPSNDGATIWRIAKYEDGPSYGLLEMRRDREFWGTWKWKGSGPYVDVEDWERWEMWDSTQYTRADAIQAALRH